MSSTQSAPGEAILAARRGTLDRDDIFACCGALLAHCAADAVVAHMRRSTGV